MKPELIFSWFSSLTKILPDSTQLPAKYSHGESLQNERFNFQLFFRSRNMHNRTAEMTVKTDLPAPLTIRQTVGIPVAFNGYCVPDNDVISRKNEIYPDRLKPLPDMKTRIIIRRSDTLWLTADIPADCPPGDYTVSLSFTVHPDDCDEEGRKTQKIEHFDSPPFRLTVLPAVLAPQRLKITQWLHPDCLAAVYQLPVWSEKHWEILENYMKNAAEHGMNMILVPLFTLMLNVFPGTRRKLTQLLIITKKNGHYEFDFSRFDRFIRTAEKCGITFFEISHFFSQWGLAFSPPVEVDGSLLLDGTQPGNHPEYLRLLDHLLPELKKHLYEIGIASRTVFHCSDEPGKQYTGKYKEAMTLLRKHLEKEQFRILDAINDASVCQQCGIDTPVPLTTELHKFRRIKLPERWTYYCCAPVKKAPNRFIHFPSSRNRIIGILLWKHQVDGFLHWGYNFYFEALSRYLIDPEKDPTSGEFYPPGDAFVVYPGKDGKPEDSIRHEVFLEAVQDFRALDTLAALISPEKVRKLLKQWAGKLSMTEYPRGEKAVLALRHKINQAILAAQKNERIS